MAIFCTDAGHFAQPPCIFRHQFFLWRKCGTFRIFRDCNFHAAFDLHFFPTTTADGSKSFKESSSTIGDADFPMFVWEPNLGGWSGFRHRHHRYGAWGDRLNTYLWDWNMMRTAWKPGWRLFNESRRPKTLPSAVQKKSLLFVKSPSCRDPLGRLVRSLAAQVSHYENFDERAAWGLAQGGLRECRNVRAYMHVYHSLPIHTYAYLTL